jgi:hypothetical protein
LLRCWLWRKIYPKSRTSMISQSFQINHLLPFLFLKNVGFQFYQYRYIHRILRLKVCSKPYYIIAESFVPLFNNINFLKTIFDKMIGKSITSHSPTPTMYSNFFVRCNCNRFSDKSFSLGFTYSKPISIALSLDSCL